MKKVRKILCMSILFLSLVCISKISVEAAGSSTPKFVKFTLTKSSVNMQWTKSSKCEKYVVYRKESGKNWKKLATVSNTKTAYKDKNVKTGVKYYYKIVNQTDGKSYSSAEKGVTPVKIAAPVITGLKCYNLDGKEYAQISWKSTAGSTYHIYGKTMGESSYKKVGTKKAKGTSCVYSALMTGTEEYVYTVVEEKKVGEMAYKLSDYDEAGVTTIREKPGVKVDFTNLKATVKWNAIPEADGYVIYRKYRLNGEYQSVGTVKGKENCSFVDVYHETRDQEFKDKYTIEGYFIDPSINGEVYTVRAYKVVDGKKIYSNYHRDGDLYLETPTIVSVKKTSDTTAQMEWSTIKNAQKYYLYSGYVDSTGKHWQKVASVTAKEAVRQTASVNVNKKHTYFTVKAVSTKAGKTVTSDYDKTYRIDQRHYDKENILYIGDSITFGSPYKGTNTVEVFSYPWRVNQLTGAQYYNPSIPGATYSYKEGDSSSYHRYRMVTDVAQKIKEGKTPLQALHPNSKTYKDFDVVVMAAGTNDYLDDTVLGSVDSKNIGEFNGAINQIVSWINEGSEQRVKEGKAPIKIVFVDLFYSDRTYDYAQLTDRRFTKNKIGLTLTDYQNSIDSLVEKYRQSGMDVYQFETDHIVTKENCPIATSDNLHMSRYTYGQIGNQFSSFLIDQKILKPSEKSKWVEYDPNRYGDVKKNTSLLAEPKAGASLMEIPSGERILLDGYEKFADGSWYKTNYNGKTGYVSAADVKLSYQAYDPDKTGKTTANLYMRSGVGLNYGKKSYIKEGSKVKIYGYYRTEGYDWYYINHNGVKGYVSSKYVKREEKETPSWVAYDVKKYGDLKTDTKLRAASGADAQVIATLQKGDRILLEGYDKYKTGSWYKTSYNGTTGYVAAEDVKLSYQKYDPNKKGKTTANLYMRSGVGLNYKKKVRISSGSEVTLYGYYRTEGYDWYYINYNGVKGYVSSKYVERM